MQSLNSLYHHVDQHLFLCCLYKSSEPSRLWLFGPPLAFAATINLTAALEISQAVARSYPEETDFQYKIAYASSAFWFTLGCYSLLRGIAFADETDCSFCYGTTSLESLFKLELSIFGAMDFNLIQNQFRWELRSYNYAIISLNNVICDCRCCDMADLWNPLGSTGLLLGMAGSLVGAISGLWWLRNSFRFVFDVVRLREMLTFSSPLVFSGAAVWISLYIDRILINHFLSASEVGLYGIGYRLSSIAGLVMVGFQGALTPLIYTYHREEDTPRQLARIFRLFLAFALIMFLGLSLFSIDILALFYDGTFLRRFCRSCLSCSCNPVSTDEHFAPGIDIAKKTYLHIWINVGGIYIAVLNYFLIPILGIVGSGLATLLGYLFVFTVYMVKPKYYKVPHRWYQVFIAVILAAILAGGGQRLVVVDLVRWFFSIFFRRVFL
ncbi:MAG: polysaccharide biosynthesis protein [Anaerolineales bacterium]|nr:polysaccharide biosynthesis protein [Anaerolineales bacterium]